MAFAVTDVQAYGEFIDEAVTKRALQTVKLTFTRTSDGDGTIGLSDDALSANDFWHDAEANVTYAAVGALAHKLWNDVTTKAECLAATPLLIQSVASGAAHLCANTPSNYDNIGGDSDVSVARVYSEMQVVMSGFSLVDFDIDVFDAATGTTVITCTLVAKYILKPGEKPVTYFAAP